MNRLFAFFIAITGALAVAGCSSAPKVAATAPVAAAPVVEDVPAPVVDPSMTPSAFLQAVDQSDALKITLGKMAVAKAMGEPPGATIAAQSQRFVIWEVPRSVRDWYQRQASDGMNEQSIVSSNK